MLVKSTKSQKSRMFQFGEHFQKSENLLCEENASLLEDADGPQNLQMRVSEYVSLDR